MNAVSTAPGRGPFQGVAQIMAFNWPKYAASVPLGLLLVIAPALAPSSAAWLTLASWACAAVLAWWTVASVAASHWVYDRSGLYDLGWLGPLVRRPRRWAAIHAGLDEFSPLIERRLGTPAGAVLDIYDPALMPERSIARARAAAGAPAPTTDYRRLPLPTGCCDAVFLVLAAHELRHHTHRSALFAEVRRILADGGRAVVVEHLRDVWNLAAFGPGFTHFFSRREWLSTFARAGLRVQAERSITPLVRVFVLSRSEP